jgi:DUF971 family protein
VADAPVPDVTSIEVDRERGVTVTFEDGHECHFVLEDLRVNCPCAMCRTLRDQGRAPWEAEEGDPLRVLDAELVGAYGLRLTWSDRHSTGIYTWVLLRSWCEGA